MIIEILYDPNIYKPEAKWRVVLKSSRNKILMMVPFRFVDSQDAKDYAKYLGKELKVGTFLALSKKIDHRS